MTEELGGLDFDPQNILINQGLWLIGPKDFGGSLFDLCVSLGKVSNAEGNFVVAFTDEDLARRFIERMREKELLSPYRPSGWSEMVEILEALQKMGHTHLAIDPELNSDQRTSIRQLLVEIHRRT
jgi:hypothetical protein